MRLNSFEIKRKKSVLFVLFALSICVLSVVATRSLPMVHAESLSLTVTNTNDTGTGSLRAAIIAANASSTAATAPHHITFAISGSGVQTISLLSVLPTVTQPTIIDGSTQTGAQCGDLVKDGADGMIQSSNTPHQLTIQVTGRSMTMTSSDRALILFGSGSNGSELKGMVVNGSNSASGSGNAVFVQSQNVKLDCNYFGVEPDGMTPVAATSTASVVQVGTNATGATVTNNIIGRNSGGASITTGAASIVVSYNLIGVDKTGLARITTSDTTTQVGISYNSAGNGSIAHNVIAGAGTGDNYGIMTGWSDNSIGLKIRGNYVNVGIDGTTSLGRRNGIYTFHAVQIGGPDMSDRNIINGPTRPNSSAGTLVENNYMGVVKDGSRTIEPDIGSSSMHAIYLGYGGHDGTVLRNNTIGGFTAGITGDQRTNDDGTFWCSNVTIEDNWIGVTKTGVTVANNGGIGWNMIGFNCADSVIRRNIIGGSLYIGMNLGTMLRSQIYGNIVGGMKNGINIPKNNSIGIQLYNPSGTVIGRENDGNVIANNGNYGLSVTNGGNAQIEYNTITGNQTGVYIANDTKGTIRKNSIFGNTNSGIMLQGYQYDVNDVDTGGGNDGQNAPVAVSYTGCLTANPSGAVYLLQSKPNTTYTIDVYGNDTTSNVQGKTWLNQLTVTTDSQGIARFARPTASDGSAVSNMSMTATDPDGNTSPFGVEKINATDDCWGSMRPSIDGDSAYINSAVYFDASTGTYANAGFELIDQNNNVVYSSSANTDGGSSWSIYFYNNDASGIDSLPDGRYTLRTSFTDMSSGARLSFDTSVDKDTTTPTGTITSPSETASTSPEITGTVDDPSAGVWVCVAVDDEDGEDQHCYDAVNNSDGTWALPSGTITPGLSLGNYKIYVVFYDAVNNWSAADAQFIVVRADADAPVVNDVRVDADKAVVVTGTYDATNSVSFSVTVHGRKYVLGIDPELTANGNNWSLLLSAETTKPMGGIYNVAAATTTRGGDTVMDATNDELTVVGLIQPPANGGDKVSGGSRSDNGELAPTGADGRLMAASGVLLALIGGAALTFFAIRRRKRLDRKV